MRFTQLSRRLKQSPADTRSHRRHHGATCHHSRTLLDRETHESPFIHQSSNAKISNLRRWRLTERLSQDLWKIWSTTYLQSLHHRTKWTAATSNVKIGDVVFVKDETLQHRTWPIAKIIKIYPGPDKVVRTVDLLCHGKSITRAVNRLIPCVMTLLQPPRRMVGHQQPTNKIKLEFSPPGRMFRTTSKNSRRRTNSIITSNCHLTMHTQTYHLVSTLSTHNVIHKPENHWFYIIVQST